MEDRMIQQIATYMATYYVGRMVTLRKTEITKVKDDNIIELRHSQKEKDGKKNIKTQERIKKNKSCSKKKKMGYVKT